MTTTTKLVDSNILGQLSCKETQIKVPNGWKTMGDIKVGDEVLTFDGKAAKVISISHITERKPAKVLGVIRIQ